jgi:signal transduction histidine kinase
MEFRISSELKNIIGKDLIVNDEVAIFELVKNSYDAHATRVDIEFQKDKISIRDNGKGMDFDDLQNKWLFVAYSAKKDGSEDEELESDKKYIDYRNKINLKRGFAGAKGIGRFSSDRLGSNLRLISKKISSNIIEGIDVDWDKFEMDSKNEFINIGVDYCTPVDANNISLRNGTIIEMTNLHSIWDDGKIKKLKRSLGKLINPFEVNTKSNNFQIYIKQKNSIFEEPVLNELINVLTMKTTKLDVVVKNDRMISTLTDRGTLIYEIEEINKYKFLKNTSITLFYLNLKAKNNFKRRMDIASVEFGHVLLFNNGFRVYPYGEEYDDSFGINRKHQQGYNRTLSTRNIVGSININEYSEQFKEKSSRDSGLIETHGYDELEQLFWDKGLKRLQKYVVGIQWSLEEVIRNQDNDSESSSVLENIDSKSKIIELISKLANSKDIKVKNFDGNFLNLLKDKIDPSSLIVSKLSKIATDTKDLDLIQEIENAKKVLESFQKEQLLLKTEVNQNQKIITQLKSEKEIITKDLDYEKIKTTSLANDLENKTKESIFKSSILGTEKEQILGLQHQIYHSSSRVNRNIKLLLNSFNLGDLSDKQKKYMSVIALEADKITSISNFITKANFNLTASDISVDIISFIKEYIQELYLSNNKMIDSDLKISNFIEMNNNFIIRIRPLEITTMIDNLIQNAEKANASKIEFKYKIDANKVHIQIIDNGNGITENNLEKIFEMGYTTTSGSGIGLYNTQSIVRRMNGSISVKSNSIEGTTFSIRLSK